MTRRSTGSPHIIYEKGDGGANFDAIQRNVEAYLGAGRAKGKKEDKSESKKMIILKTAVDGLVGANKFAPTKAT